MRIIWQYQKNRKKAVIFCNGWGMDCTPLRPLASQEYDILHLYDFRDMQDVDQILTEIAGYEQRILIGWSMGVWCGQNLFADHARLFSRTIAINGTLCPVHDRYGIPKDLFTGTMASWSEISRSKFYHRLAGGGEVERIFLRNQPQRALDSQQQELAYYLENTNCIAREKSIYREILVSDRDRIVPTANQREYWGNGIVELTGGHFPFYQWPGWDELLMSSLLNLQ